MAAAFRSQLLKNFTSVQKWSSPRAYSSSSIDPRAICKLLDANNLESREDLRQFLAVGAMVPRYNIPLADEREVALRRLKMVCDAGFISVLDFRRNPLKIFATHELCAVVDPSMTTKMTVQFNLFGGTVLKLGTRKHHDKFLGAIDSLDAVGCFGLTELGFGNNAVEMETVATYKKVTTGVWGEDSDIPIDISDLKNRRYLASFKEIQEFGFITVFCKNVSSNFHKRLSIHLRKQIPRLKTIDVKMAVFQCQ